MSKPDSTEKLEHINLRSDFKLLQLTNPNYFGNLNESKFKAIQVIAGNVFYEELKCVSYNPFTKMLNAAISIKQNGGYGGNSCTNGSLEYVRFYVDYLRDGNWIDEGLASTNVHDLPFQEDLCYNVQLKLNAKKQSCCDDPAILPRVKAILSWNSAPPANHVNWNPVWGNTMQTNIQIAPSKSIWCLLKKDIFIDDKIKNQLLLNLDKLQLTLPPVPPQPEPIVADPSYFKKLYQGKIEDTRLVVKHVAELKKYSAISTHPEFTLPIDFDWHDIISKIPLLKFDTTFEEVKCVALNRELNSLHASVIIKKPSGYLGNLCQAGTKEYVAFYMDFGAGYKYMGTSSTSVHDINTIPRDGLWYNLALPVDLQPHQKAWCNAGKAKLKAILSWNVAPPVNNPNYIAAYGDWEECTVEIKPLPDSVVPGKQTIILEKVGGMVVADIDNATGLATTGLTGSLGGALHSPFYGTMELIGNIFFATSGMQYRFLVTKPGGTELPLTDQQIITTDTSGVFDDETFNPASDGWIPYFETASTKIVGDLLGRYMATTPGKHIIRIQAKDSTNVIYNDPNGAVTILVDDKAPVVQIDIDPVAGGNCGDITIGQSITGTYSYTDSHAGSLNVTVTPANGAVVQLDATSAHVRSYYAGTLPDGSTSGTFTIDTSAMVRCGYNVRIDATDRTIVNSHTIGLPAGDLQGFCLRDKPLGDK
jgi:hypothetical protein